MTLDDDQLAALSSAKLVALLRENLGHEVDLPSSAGSGVGIVVDETAWIYQPRDPDRAVGHALVWAAGHGASSVHLILDDVPDFAAFAAAGCTDAFHLHRVDGRELISVAPTVAPLPVAPDADHPLLAALEAEGLDIVAGHAMWFGEVLGLEVARLIGSGPDIQVGVGAYDRGAFEALYPDQSPLEALPRVVDEVRRHRHVGAAPHLLQRLVRERWLRSAVCGDPQLIGLDDAYSIPGIEPRPGLHETVPDAALGHVGSEQVLVVTGVGIDPGVVAHGAALLARTRAERLVIGVPERDRHEVIAAAATTFIAAAVTVTGLAPPWA